MLFEKRERDIEKKHYPYDYDFEIERDEYLIPLYFVDSGKRKGRILIEKKFGNCVCLWSIKIYEEYQKQGFGKLMLKETLKYITTKLHDTKKIELFVYKNNTIAIALYKKLGFKISKEYSHTDEYLMEIILKNS